MEKLSSDKVKNDIVQSPEISLQDFVEISENIEGRLEVRIKYCDDQLNVLFYPESPLDFLILNQDLLTMEDLNDKNPPDFSAVAVADAVKWLISLIKENMMSKLEFFPSVTPLRDLVKELEKENVIDPGSYEISVDSNKIVLILRMRQENDMDIRKLEVKDINEVAKASNQYYLIKLALKTDNGHLIIPESKVHFSSSFITAFPELNKIRLDDKLQTESIIELIHSIKDNVNAELSSHYECWEKRKTLLLSLHDILSNKGAKVTVDLIKMLKLQMGFQSSSGGKYVLEMELAHDFPKSGPKTYLTRKDRGEDQRVNINEITGFMTANMTNDEIVNKMLDILQLLMTKLN